MQAHGQPIAKDRQDKTYHAPTLYIVKNPWNFNPQFLAIYLLITPLCVTITVAFSRRRTWQSHQRHHGKRVSSKIKGVILLTEVSPGNMLPDNC